MLLQTIGLRQVNWKIPRPREDLNLNNSSVSKVNHGICAAWKLRTTDERCMPPTIHSVILTITAAHYINKEPNARMMP